jgi:hypothetical protein
MCWGRAHVRTPWTSASLEDADLLLELLDVLDGLVEDLQLKLFFLPLLVLPVRGLLRAAGAKLVVLVVLVWALVIGAVGTGSILLAAGIGRHEVSEHREGFVDFGAPGLLDARMVLPAHRFPCGT